MNPAFAEDMAKKQREESVRNALGKYGAQLSSFVRSKVNRFEDVEDILQEVWFQLSRLSNIDDLQNIGAWLYSVSGNKITDFYRKKKTERLEDFAFEDEEGNFSFKEVLLLDDSHNPELALFKEAFWTALMEGLQELPEKQRNVFVLNEIDDKTMQQIADETGESIKTIISRKGYAVKHLRKKLYPLYRELNQ
jgi:RNA polymerase sigma factor (sigma-70 family)